MTAAFRRAGTALFWTLGPYRDGLWSFLLGDGVRPSRSRAVAASRFRGRAGFSLKIRYESPAGWATYSPELAAELRASRMRWSRPAARATVNRRDGRSP